MKTRILFISLLIINTIACFAQPNITPNKPVLVVELVVDNMRSDYLQRFDESLSDNGIKKLINNGTYFNYANYPYKFTHNSADYASISTGTYPAKHGISAQIYFNKKNLKLTQTIADEDYFNVGGQRELTGYSAKNLLATTIGDELKKSTLGESKVFAVSPSKHAATLLGGHAADAAYWINDVNGEWCTSSYYRGSLPLWLQKLNRNGGAKQMLTIGTWDLLKTKNQYKSAASSIRNSPANNLPISFANYQNRNKKYSILKSTPFANSLTVDMTLELIENEQLGRDEYPDLLSLNFSCNNTSKIEITPHSLRMEDLFLRLDKDIERLLTYLDKEIGTHKYVVILTSTQGASDTPETLSYYRLPGKVFQSQRSLALLNSYLMAMYGQGKWILDYHNQQIYFNHELIKKSNVTLETILSESAAFVEDITGVAYAFSAIDLKSSNGNASELFKSVQNSYYPGKSGDIILVLEPGWIELRDDNRYPGLNADSYKRVPVIFYGWKVGRDKINTRISPLDIAPTVANMLGISFPNRANGSILKISRFPF